MITRINPDVNTLRKSSIIFKWSKKRLQIALVLLVGIANSVQAQHHLPELFSDKSGLGSSDVSTSNGTFTYSLPLMNLNSYGVNVPINLVYVGDGIKPSSQASWVGQGWILEPGGSMNREVNGIPDDIKYDDNFKGYFSAGNHPPEGDNGSGLISSWTDYQPDLLVFNTANGFNGSLSLKKPYYYDPSNINVWPLSGSSGSTFFNYENNIAKMMATTGNYGTLAYFTLSDANGLKYQFGNYQGGVNTIAKQSWNKDGSEILRAYSIKLPLIRITNELNEDAYVFSYNANETEIEMLNHNTQRYRSASSAMNSSSLGTSKIIEVLTSYLSRIDYENGYVLFELNADDRLDLAGHKALKKVRAYDNNDNLIIEYEFLYSYQTGYTSDNIRLFLNEIKIRNSLENDFVSYCTFSYSNIIDGIINPLPFKNTREIDYWGYFNKPGLNANGDILNNNSALSLTNALLPDVLPNVLSNDDPNTDNIASIIRKFQNPYSNRNPNETYAQAGILTSISFSGGSKTRIQYELNEYSSVDGLHEVESEFEQELDKYALINTYNEYARIELPILSKSQWVDLTYDKTYCPDNTGEIEAVQYPVAGQVGGIILPHASTVSAYLEAGVTYSVYINGCPVNTSLSAPYVRINSYLSKTFYELK